jgi:hypothetical protein
MLFIPVTTLVLLGCCWYVADVEFRTKAILTAISLVTWAAWILVEGGGLIILAFVILDAVLWYVTFGLNIPSRRI